MALEQEISKGIMEAMKAKDTVRLTTLRNVKKYIIEAKTASAGITELSDAEVLKIIAKLAKQDHAVTDRNVLRSELIRARKALAPADWERHSAAVQRRVLALPEWRDARTVAMYIAVRNEISTDEIIRRAWAEGKQVLLPRCLPPSEGEGIMEFVLCRGYDELTPGAFGLSEPGPACVPLPRTGWEQDAAGTFVPPSGTDASLRLPDLILVPAVGISPAGARLGYGKGFYDRLLALPGWGGAKRLALVHSFQLAAFPAGPLDIPMHGYATEKELIWL